MTVLRIVPNISASSVAEMRAFYQSLFDLEIVMDLGWIVTLSSAGSGPIQLSIASEGGSGTQVPDLSIEVDDVDAVYRRAQAAGVDIAYEMTDEPWGVRRFYLRDPAGRVLNVLSHQGTGA